MKPVLLVATVGVALLSAACLSTGVSKEEPAGDSDGDLDLTRVGEFEGVTVNATWLTPEDLEQIDADIAGYPLDSFVLVEIQFTTHSGDLGEIAMEKASVLRQNGEDVQPEGWVSTSDDSHHRAGILVFPRQLEDGPVEITIDIGDGDVALLWEAAPTT